MCWFLGCVWLFATPWTVACQTPLSMGFSRQEYWSELPFSTSGNLPDPGIEPRPLASQADSFPCEPSGEPLNNLITSLFPYHWSGWKWHTLQTAFILVLDPHRYNKKTREQAEELVATKMTKPLQISSRGSLQMGWGVLLLRQKNNYRAMS